MARAVIYRRVSTRFQTDGTSLESQMEDCHNFCAKEGHGVVDVIEDIGERDDLEVRKGLTRVRQIFRSGQADVLVVWKYDRLSGDPLQFSIIIHEIERQAGGQIVSVREPVEEGPMKDMQRYMYAFGAQMEVRAIRERIRRSRDKRVANGAMLPHATPLYGYDWADERKTTYVINSEKAVVVERIFREVAAGMTYPQITKGLERDGVPSPSGGRKWHHITVRRMVKHPFYWGDTSAWRSRIEYRQVIDPVTGEIKKLRYERFNDTNPVVLPSVPAIVSRELAMEAHAALKERASGQAPRGGLHEEFLLRGRFVTCGECGRQLVCHRDPTRKLVYRCQSRYTLATGGQCRTHQISRDALDFYTWEAAVAWVNDHSVLERAIRARIDAGYTPADKERETLEAIIKNAEKVMRQCSRVIGDPDSALLDDDPVYFQYEAAKQRRKEAKKDLAEFEERMLTWEQLRSGVESSMEWCIAVVNDPTAMFTDRRRVLHTIGLSVKVYARTAHWRHQPLPQIEVVLECGETTSNAPRTSQTTDNTYSQGVMLRFAWDGATKTWRDADLQYIVS